MTTLDTVPRPGQCARPVPGAFTWSDERCGGNLADVSVLTLPDDHPVLAAQALLLETIENGTARFGIYRTTPQPVAIMLAELGFLVKKIDYRALGGPQSPLPTDLRTAYLREPAGINPVHGRAPVRAAVAAASTTTAMRILELPDPGPAVDDLRPLLRRPCSQDRKQLARNTSPTLTDIMRVLWP